RHRGVEGLFSLLVVDQFYGPNQPHAACLADQRMAAELTPALLEMRHDGPDMIERPTLLGDFQGLDPDRGGDRMAGIREAVGEDADFLALAQEGIVNLA